MSLLGLEIRQAVRRLLRHRGFSATVVLTLALGVGPMTALFSLAYALLIQPLPFPDSSNLFRLRTVLRENRAVQREMSLPDLDGHNEPCVV